MRDAFKGTSVLECGCGHGLPGILATILGGSRVTVFQDYNEDVLMFVVVSPMPLFFLFGADSRHFQT